MTRERNLAERVRALRLFCAGLVGGVLLGLVWILSPVVRIRVGTLVTERIGHLTANTEYWFRRRDPATVKGWEINIFITGLTVCNEIILEKISERMTVIRSRLVLYLYFATQRLFPRNRIWINLDSTGTFDYAAWNNDRRLFLPLSEAERGRGAEILESLGIPSDADYVCFAARDSAYLNDSSTTKNPGGWAYHDHRDVDIENFMPMAEEMAARGYWVLRMGAVVSAPLQTDNPRIIDYASYHRSAFGDVFLLGNSKFFIGDTAGIYRFASSFGRPVGLTNMTPLAYLNTGSGPNNNLVMPKRIRRVGDGTLLSLKDELESGADDFTTDQKFLDAGMMLVQNSAAEIASMARELDARIDGTWRDLPEDEELQQRFWSLIPEDHRLYGSPDRVATGFLRENRDFLN